MTSATQTVDPEEIARFSRIAEEWWDENGKFRPLHRIGPVRIGYIRDQASAHFRRDPQMLQALSGLSLIDIGCGGGLMCEPMARLGADVTGIDASDRNIAVASLHAERMGLAVDYRAAPPEALATDGTQYDIVLALEIIEHVADVPAFIHACAGLLKPGGILFLSTLNRTFKSYALSIIGAEYILRWLPRGTHDWRRFLKPSEICSGLRTESLDPVNMAGIVFNPLKNRWRLDDKDVDVNYIVAAVKPA